MRNQWKEKTSIQILVLWTKRNQEFLRFHGSMDPVRFGEIFPSFFISPPRALWFPNFKRQVADMAWSLPAGGSQPRDKNKIVVRKAAQMRIWDERDRQHPSCTTRGRVRIHSQLYAYWSAAFAMLFASIGTCTKLQKELRESIFQYWEVFEGELVEALVT